MEKIKKVVLAYSGGLDTSVIPRWLMETYGCEVVTFSANLGQEEPFQELKKKALNSGVSKTYVEDLKEEFVRDFVFPLLRANAIYEEGYLLGTAIARPLIAKRQIEIAHKEKADAVSHGATGKGNDQVRFELTYLSLNPKIKIVAPWRLWHFNSRQSLIAYAKKHKIPIEASAKRPYSIDRNLFHVSFEGGILEDPWQEPKEDMFILTTPPEKAPDKPTYFEITYEQGNPVAINDKLLSPSRLLTKLNRLGGINGIGRVDMVENRYVGMKSRGVYETPGGTILHIAHRALESITLDREVMHLKDSLIIRYAELVYYGYWFSPEREILQRTIDETQRDVTGTVRIKLYKGNCTVVGRKSPKSLYHPDYATFEEDKVYDQKLADGFIQLNALRLKIRNLLRKKG
ncbi:MAG: argininosuccinate synthase [Deltaproteobacteria bacterium DG_8]|nr:MAG: argininosuccinate synthase [Deltaproteobacteria bacterium DG_8]